MALLIYIRTLRKRMVISVQWNYPRNMGCTDRITADASFPTGNEENFRKGKNNYGTIMGRKIYQGNRPVGI